MTLDHYQVTIIGGGPAGSTCAIQLMKLGFQKVLLIESKSYDQFRIGESIPPEANQIFHQLGIYNDFVAEKHQPCYGSCSYWGSPKRGYNDFFLNAHGHGWHLDRSRFNRFLANQAANLGAMIRIPATFQKAQKRSDCGYDLTFKNEENKQEIIQTDIVVDASGPRSIFALQQGYLQFHISPIICLGLRYQLQDSSHKISKLTHLESTADGWWYAASIPNDQLLVAFYTDASIVKSKKLNQLTAWLELLETAPNLKKLTAELKPYDNRPKGFAAPSFKLNQAAGLDWLSIGDAASAYDPITSQGIMKSMFTALEAAHAIAKRLNGELENFSAYNEWIQAQFEQYLNMRHYFYQLERRWVQAPFWAKFHASQKVH